MDSLLERFCRYVKVNTQASETSDTYPSTSSQVAFNRDLKQELESVGLQDVSLDEHGILMGTIPATMDGDVPVIAWVAHVDTSPETTAENVSPQIHKNYAGNDLTLPGDPSKVIRVDENPELSGLVGKTIITTDGTTLLGADDKAGVAAIVEAAERLIANPEIPHGPIRVCFTCDEEIGHGVDHVDFDRLGAVVAYTLDGPGTGVIDAETFSADLALVKVRGVNTHPSVGKDRLVNAIRILSDFIARLPTNQMAPETTEGRDGFLHPYQIEGGVAEASARVLLRDFETSALKEQAALLEATAEALRANHPHAEIDIEIIEQYRNMREGLLKEPRAVAYAVESMSRVGLTPEVSIIRGGTDGSRLTELGLPTPNLSTGEHNPHSPLEWTCLEEMDVAVRVLIELAQVWAQDKGVQA